MLQSLETFVQPGVICQDTTNDINVMDGMVLREYCVINSKQSFKITTDSVREIVLLKNTQDEAHTHMIFRAEHSSTQYTGPPHVIIHTPDTDVVLLALAFHKFINSPLFIKIGNKDKARIVNIVEVIKNIQTRMKEEMSSDIGETILGLHAFLG